MAGVAFVVGSIAVTGSWSGRCSSSRPRSSRSGWWRAATTRRACCRRPAPGGRVLRAPDAGPRALPLPGPRARRAAGPAPVALGGRCTARPRVVVLRERLLALHRRIGRTSPAGVDNPGVGGLPMARDPFLAATLFTDAGIYLLCLLITLVLAVVRLARDPPRRRSPSVDARADARVVPAAGRRSARSTARTSARRLLRPAGGPAWLRRDPADAYLREPGRRLDRRGRRSSSSASWSFALRLPPVAARRAARTCTSTRSTTRARPTEWLSDWEHGWTRDVYEWTHPMLAKYLIAGGIVLADPNKVVGTLPVGRPSRPFLAVAPAASRVATTARSPSPATADDDRGSATPRPATRS